MIRKLLIIWMVTPFALLCLYDLWHGRYKTGTVSGLFGVCNFLIYWDF